MCPHPNPKTKMKWKGKKVSFYMLTDVDFGGDTKFYLTASTRCTTIHVVRGPKARKLRLMYIN